MGLADFVEFWYVLFTSYLTSIYRLFVPPGKVNVEGQIAVVTGAGHGIGREISLELARAGAVVVGWDINKEGNEETTKMVKQTGGQGYSFVVDVTNTDQIASTARQIRSEIGEVSILVNNAGYINCANLLELSVQAIRKTFEVNALAQFWTVREFLPSMLERKKGRIVNIASMAGFHGTQKLTDYSASKFASRGFCDSLRRELQADNYRDIKVTCVCPMYVDTGFLWAVEVKESEKLTPQQVAKATVDGMLCGKETVFVPSSFEWMTRLNGLFPKTFVEYGASKSTFVINTQYKKDE